MVNEGIMALPQGEAISGEQAQSPQQFVTSADSYDAALTALGMVNPGEDVALKEAIRQNIGDLQLTPEQLEVMIQVFEYISQNPGDYKNLLQELIGGGALDKGDMPDEYDPEFIGAMLAVLQEMRQMQGAGAQEPMNLSPVVEGLQPIGMASGGLADVGQYLAAKGRGGDSILAHITPEEAQMLRRRGGSGTINPATGLPEFKGGVLGKVVGAVKGVVKGVAKVVKTVLKSPVGRILGTIALAAVLGPASAGFSFSLGLSAPVAAGLAGAGTTLLAGGSVKDALIAGAMGYVGGGGTIMGTSPVAALGGYLPGAAGSALNTGLTTGVIGAGIGKLGGMSTQDALRMGLTSGASAAALTAMNPPAGTDATGQPPPEGAAQPAPGADIGATPTIEAPGPLGTAKEYTGYGLKMPAPPSSSLGVRPPEGFQADYSLGAPASSSPAFDYSLVAPSTAPVPGMEGAMGSGLRMTAPAMTGASGMGDAMGTGLRAPVSPATMSNGAANYGLSATAATPTPPGFVDKMVSGAEDVYNEYLSPSRAGLPADAGYLRKYGPLAAVGTAAIAAFGGMEGEPADQNPAFNRNYTGVDYMRDNPNKFSGGLSSYTKPTTLDSPIVPAPSYSTIPISPIASVTPRGVTQSPGNVAQPYNMSGLYGVPLMYGPDGQLRRMAKGGDAQMTNFPRKNGPINGRGTGTSDDIPAMLSDGEFVFTAKAVRNAGDGSRRKGAARMYKLMKKLEGGAVKGN